MHARHKAKRKARAERARWDKAFRKNGGRPIALTYTGPAMDFGPPSHEVQDWLNFMKRVERDVLAQCQLWVRPKSTPS